MFENPLVKFLILYAATSFAGWLFACIGISGMRDTRKREAREAGARGGLQNKVLLMGQCFML